MLTEFVQPVAETASITEESSQRLRKFAGAVMATAGVGLLGGGVGSVVGLETAAHLEVGGSHADAYANISQPYHQIGIKDAMMLKIPNSNPYVGGTVYLNSAPSLEVNGHFDAKLAAEYLQLFSNSKLIANDVTWAIEKHLLEDSLVGALVAMGVFAGGMGLRRSYRSNFTEDERTKFHEFVHPKVRFAQIAVGSVALAVFLPVGESLESNYPTLHADPNFAGTMLAGSELDGPLGALVDAGGSYIRKYISNTDNFYNTLMGSTLAYLDSGAVTLPTGPHLRTFMYRTDEHCNTGMDRVQVAVMKKLGLKVLVSGGDDDFSGSFSFESGCTKGIAELSKKAKVTNVFVGGNHDSAMTRQDEQKQGILVLNGKIITVKDSGEPFNFLGTPDQRQSRYGHGIVPASNADQKVLTNKQGEQTGKIACGQRGNVIAVMHDPSAGRLAVEKGCGRILLSMAGHTHDQVGPTEIALPDGSRSYQIIGGSSGGAPTDGNRAGLAESVTVGPLQNDAFLNLVTIDTKTQELVANTVIVVKSDLSVSSTQTFVNSPNALTPAQKHVATGLGAGTTH